MRVQDRALQHALQRGPHLRQLAARAAPLQVLEHQLHHAVQLVGGLVHGRPRRGAGLRRRRRRGALEAAELRRGLLPRCRRLLVRRQVAGVHHALQLKDVLLLLLAVSLLKLLACAAAARRDRLASASAAGVGSGRRQGRSQLRPAASSGQLQLSAQRPAAGRPPCWQPQPAQPGGPTCGHVHDVLPADLHVDGEQVLHHAHQQRLADGQARGRLGQRHHGAQVHALRVAVADLVRHVLGDQRQQRGGQRGHQRHGLRGSAGSAGERSAGRRASARPARAAPVPAAAGRGIQALLGTPGPSSRRPAHLKQLGQHLLLHRQRLGAGLPALAVGRAGGRPRRRQQAEHHDLQRRVHERGVGHHEVGVQLQQRLAQLLRARSRGWGGSERPGAGDPGGLGALGPRRRGAAAMRSPLARGPGRPRLRVGARTAAAGCASCARSARRRPRWAGAAGRRRRGGAKITLEQLQSLMASTSDTSVSCLRSRRYVMLEESALIMEIRPNSVCASLRPSYLRRSWLISRTRFW